VTADRVSVVVALHGAGQRAAKALEQWAPVLDLGFALLCVESSQLMSPMYRTWPDPEHARQDIDRAIAQLPDELGDLPLIAAGFSAGGRAALEWALTSRPLPAAGVVVLAPAIRELPAEAKRSLSPAKILIGMADDPARGGRAGRGAVVHIWAGDRASAPASGTSFPKISTAGWGQRSPTVDKPVVKPIFPQVSGYSRLQGPKSGDKLGGSCAHLGIRVWITTLV
jgi:pimeloyl-ACP methyl ester carboxylesterase